MLAELTYRNLDDEPGASPGTNTTTEVLAQRGRRPARRAAARRRARRRRRAASTAIAVTLHESHVAWASYERAL